MTRTEHIRTLAEELGVECLWHDGGLHYAWAVLATPTFIDRFQFRNAQISWRIIDQVRPGMILTPSPSRGVTAYWAAMHELGHLASDQDVSIYRENRIKFEVQAWDWAIHHAAFKRTPYIQKLIATRWLGSHAILDPPKGKWETEFCRRMGVQVD